VDREQKIQRLIELADRFVMQQKFSVPAETVVVDELEQLIRELKQGGERAIG
jgi:hypothetical protein